MGITLGQLFAGVPCRGLDSTVGGMVVCHITQDSRQVGLDTLFVALSDGKHDGMRFAPDAASRGAVAVLGPRNPTEEERARCYGVVWIVAEKSREMLPELAARVYGYPTRRLREDA